jgi:hypothetical protein
MVRRFSQSFMHGTVPTNCVRKTRSFWVSRSQSRTDHKLKPTGG